MDLITNLRSNEKTEDSIDADMREMLGLCSKIDNGFGGKRDADVIQTIDAITSRSVLEIYEKWLMCVCLCLCLFVFLSVSLFLFLSLSLSLFLSLSLSLSLCMHAIVSARCMHSNASARALRYAPCMSDAPPSTSSK